MPNLNTVCVLGRVMPIQGRGIVGCPECGGPQLWLEGVIVRGDVVVPVLLPLWAVYLGQDGLGKELPPPAWHHPLQTHWSLAPARSRVSSEHTPSHSARLGAQRGVSFPSSAVGCQGSGFRGHS